VITALDHLAIGGSAAAYETLLGRRATDGRLRTGNVGLTFSRGETGLRSMTFATADLGKAATLLERRAVPVTRDFITAREAELKGREGVLPWAS